MDYVFPPQAPSSVAIANRSERFPVRRIFCVGRNYVAHAHEMGGNPDREPPFFFSKPADTIVDHGATIPFPVDTSNLHHEAELVVAIGTGGTDIAVEEALSHVWGYAPGNDLTRRDLQNHAKEMRRPWDMAKGFDRSGIVGAICPADVVGHPATGAIKLTVNGELKQDGDLADQIWPVPEIVSFLSRTVEIAPGDLIMTGTPAGVGPLRAGDVCTVSIEGLGEVTTTFS